MLDSATVPAMQTRAGERTTYVMLVEDDPTLSRVFTIVLSGAGFHVASYLSPTQALEAIRETPDSVDVVLSDVHMPTLAGDKLAREIQTLRPDLPVILMSGSGAFDVPANVSAIVEKPVSAAELVRVVEAAAGSAVRLGTAKDGR
ncbi:MAG TPA: response regulator [Gemmatimonadaceae bacterium]